MKLSLMLGKVIPPLAMRAWGYSWACTRCWSPMGWVGWGLGCYLWISKLDIIYIYIHTILKFLFNKPKKKKKKKKTNNMKLEF